MTSIAVYSLVAEPSLPMVEEFGYKWRGGAVVTEGKGMNKWLYREVNLRVMPREGLRVRDGTVS